MEKIPGILMTRCLNSEHLWIQKSARKFYKFYKLLKKEINPHKSQHGECRILKALVGPDSPKFLVDVGAFDGKTISNSYYFLRRGWSGILIEPLPLAFQKLSKRYRNNPKVHLANNACSVKEGEQQFFIGTDGEAGQLGSLSADISGKTGKSISVKVQTLTNILNACNAPKDFSILSVDAEGMDYEVLQGLNFNLYQPRIIITEDVPCTEEKLEKKNRLLEALGYCLHTRAFGNSIWIYKRTPI